MRMQILDYQAPGTPTRGPVNRRATGCAIAFACITIAVNTFLVRTAAVNHGMGAVLIALAIGPFTNAVMLAFALALTPVVRNGSRGASTAPYILTVICAPITAMVIDALCIGMIDIHGC